MKSIERSFRPISISFFFSFFWEHFQHLAVNLAQAVMQSGVGNLSNLMEWSLNCDNQKAMQNLTQLLCVAFFKIYWDFPGSSLSFVCEIRRHLSNTCCMIVSGCRAGRYVKLILGLLCLCALRLWETTSKHLTRLAGKARHWGVDDQKKIMKFSLWWNCGRWYVVILNL